MSQATQPTFTRHNITFALAILATAAAYCGVWLVLVTWTLNVVLGFDAVASFLIGVFVNFSVLGWRS